MPLPLLLAGAAIIAGGYGVKKGFDAKSDFDEASSVNDEAAEIYSGAEEKLEASREGTQSALEDLGQTKLHLYRDSILPFVDVFSKIKNVDFRDDDLLKDNSLTVSKSDVLAIEKAGMSMQDVAVGGAGAIGAGGLAGLAAYGGVGALATASTGTAIGTLGGAAATNATLAWLGGGSLATGGMGVAGGTAVLGGIVAGPVLAVGGMILASKAEAAKENAYTNLTQAKAAAEQMKTATRVAKAIGLRAQQVDSALLALNRAFVKLFADLERLVANSTDYSTFSEAERKGVMMTAMLAKTLKNVMEAPLITENGAVANESRRALEESRRVLASM
ncbi:hypothetical protein [Thioalkalivibrio sp.]|uniref:hypothetical protein n=1 Tax=Thioalkalivibrio sp. TaxID=2093813 RepID=UPI00356AD6CD